MLRRIEIADPRLSSDITSVLMGTDVPPRRDFIYEHARDAELDV
jgi:DNA gyrase subunit B